MKRFNNALTYGISVTEFIEGKKANPTIQIIDWETPLRINSIHFTEEMEVENTSRYGQMDSDWFVSLMVCFGWW